MWNLVTLDGFFEGRKSWDIDWHDSVWGEELERFSVEQSKSIGALLFGRVTYQGMASFWSKEKGEIAARFSHLTQPGVSRHLKVLRDARLVNVEVKAQQRIYKLNPEGLAELYEWVAKYQAMWPETLDALERYLNAKVRGKRKRPR